MKSQKHYSKRQHSRGPRRSSGGSGGGGGNPLSRVYESNGPDVKVRGTAQTVAEKYLQLGRDAHVSGDNVMAESYYQHAEHYYRIVAAAQAYSQQSQQQYRRPSDDDLLDGDEQDEAEDAGGEEATQGGHDRPSYPRHDQPDPQPEPAEAAGDGERPQHYPRRNDQGRDRNDQSRDRNDNRGERDRYGKTRWDRGRDGNRSSGDQQPRPQRDYADPARQPQPRIEEPVREPAAEAAEPAGWEAPSFLRRPAAASDANGEKRSRYERKPKRDSAEAVEPTEAPRAVEDAPPAE